MEGTKLFKTLLKFSPGLLVFSLEASPLIRLDKVKVEEVALKEISTAVLISENCSVCEKQIVILKNCQSLGKIAFFIEGQEDRMRRLVRKKKIDSPTYLMNQDVREVFQFAESTPSIRIKSRKKLQKKEGLTDCETLKQLSKAET
jgi:hypothetical protein